MAADGAPSIEGRLYHVGIAVQDLEAAMQTYRTLFGVTAFHRIDTNYPARHRDWEGSIANRNAFGMVGPLMVELVEPGLGDGPAREFLDQRGQGIFHIGYATDHPTQRPGGVAPCFEVHSSRRADGSYGIVYLDTLDSLGYFVELVDTPIADGLIELVRQL